MNREQLESARRLFFILLGVDIAVTVIIALSNLWGLGVLADIQTGRREATPALLSTLNFWDGFGKLAILTLCAVGVGLVKWLNACYRFAKEALGATGFKSEGWTAAGWIIPIFNMFKPYQIINEIYRAGSKIYGQSDDWKKESGSGLLLTWWIFYAVTHLIVAIISKQLLRDMWRDDLSLKQSIGLIEMSTAICVISIIIAVLWFWVANLLTQRLLARNAVSASSRSAQYGYQAPAAVIRPAEPATDQYLDRALAKSSVAQATTLPVVAVAADCQPSLPTQIFAVDEDAIYAVIANELKTGVTNEGLWTRLFAECDGDENRTKVAYIKQRAEKLISLETSRLNDQLAHNRIVIDQLANADLASQEAKAKFEAEVQETALRFELSLNDARAVVRHKIAIDGKQFRYGDYRYDRLADAIAYASRVGSSSATISSAVQDSSVTQVSLQPPPEQPASLNIRSPSEIEVAALAASANVTNEHAREMLLLGVSKEYDKFVYQTYRYDRIADALNYARAEQRHFDQPPSLDQIERRLSALGYRLKMAGAFWYVKEPLGGSSNRMDIEELIAYLNEREISFSQRAH